MHHCDQGVITIRAFSRRKTRGFAEKFEGFGHSRDAVSLFSTEFVEG
jgi:hypothetical protein